METGRKVAEVQEGAANLAGRSRSKRQREVGGSKGFSSVQASAGEVAIVSGRDVGR